MPKSKKLNRPIGLFLSPGKRTPGQRSQTPPRLVRAFTSREVAVRYYRKLQAWEPDKYMLAFLQIGYVIAGPDRPLK